MKLEVPAGKYVVAVSGGVDSVVLLDMLSKYPDIQLEVAHYDHGIRPDSDEDRQFVESLATRYGLEFYYEAGKLGPKASEALARKKRYEFLRKVQHEQQAKAIITAHHQDDRLETALLNMVRGTGRRGLSSLRSSDELVRPLLTIPKHQLIAYAKANQLVWHEDSTNSDEQYLRNYLRLRIIPKLSAAKRKAFLELIDQAANRNDEIDNLLTVLLQQHVSNATLDRQWFIGLPHDVAREVLLTWLRRSGAQHIDRSRIEQLVVLAKTLSHGKLIDVDADLQLQITQRKLALLPRER
jgi:tRNA(Ile)-lysidine synthase